MFDPNSRYYGMEIAKLILRDGAVANREVLYVRRRFIPASGEMITVVEHTVTQGDRLDNITAHYLGDPTQFWRVCDANNVSHPVDLTQDIGRRIKIALPRG